MASSPPNNKTGYTVFFLKGDACPPYNLDTQAKYYAADCENDASYPTHLLFKTRSRPCAGLCPSPVSLKQKKALRKEKEAYDLDDEGFFELVDDETTAGDDVAAVSVHMDHNNKNKTASVRKNTRANHPKEDLKECPVSPLASGMQPSYHSKRLRTRHKASKPEEPLLKWLLKRRFCCGLITMMQTQSATD
ncbi:unnamed protein product [Cylicocyclus nassatus]|uniref:Uncharacterized protein n=1 Tax=Cylicocyclus nassatus TaxID=53992 RepID=A0AA36DLH3_CYLNA|nr:unnamed protein product [Cylicocyclus nassatus]